MSLVVFPDATAAGAVILGGEVIIIDKPYKMPAMKVSPAPMVL